MRVSQPLISVIVPIYKVEKYLRDTLDSVISQDIGFRKNIELILVDDGSPDSSADICAEYKNRFPENIIYIKQDNSGVGAARNKGLSYASGEYVHFLDSDDIISKDAYSKTVELLENESIDLAAFRVEFFDGRLGEHPLNHKFRNGTRVIDLNNEPDAVILHVSSCLIRRGSINTSFDPTIKISEDMKYLTELVMKKQAYGVIRDAVYLYRKRSDGSSAIDGSLLNKSYYQVTPQKVYSHLLNSWRGNDGRPHIYPQNVIMYDLQWRLRQAKQTVLSDDEEYKYKETIKSLIKQIDDDVILSQRVMSIAQKHYALRVKYNDKIPSKTLERLVGLAKNTSPPVYIDFISMNNGMVEVEGWVPEGSAIHSITAKINSIEVELIKKDTVYRRRTFLGDTVYNGGGFTARIPEGNFYGELRFYNNGTNSLSVVTKRQSKIPNKRYGYRVLGSKILVNNINSIRILKYSTLRRLLFEARWWLRVLGALRLRYAAKTLYGILKSKAKNTLSAGRFISPFTIPIVSLYLNIKDVVLRIAYWIYLPFCRRPIWIISDRFLAAGDNGEALYQYVLGRAGKDINAYFAISRESSDYKRLKNQYPNVIDSSGWRYKTLFLHASKIISSHADDFVVNPFSGRVESFYDLFDFDFIFLQHGIIRNDLSPWLNRYNKNIKLFITSAKLEYDSILEYDYCYSKDQILLSGMPRYDLLESEPKNKLIIAPTWRHPLALPPKSSDGKRPYNPDFKDSDYFKFYNSLINSHKLKDALKKHNMTAEFYLHPSFEPHVKDFESSELVRVMDFPYDYQTAFREGSIMVTDYSSVVFDFAYLKKPVIYAQFDQEEFYANQTIYVKGYMDDERDGFGTVAKDLESTVDAIVSTIESGCKMDKKYIKRVDDFFAYKDKNNRRRVYEAILNLEKSDE